MNDWLVHPYSYKDEGVREISIVHRLNEHGLKSYGWFGEDKIFINSDTMYGDIPQGIYDLCIEYAENEVIEMNKRNIELSEEILQEYKRREEVKKNINQKLTIEFNDCLERAFVASLTKRGE